MQASIAERLLAHHCCPTVSTRLHVDSPAVVEQLVHRGGALGSAPDELRSCFQIGGWAMENESTDSLDCSSMVVQNCQCRLLSGTVWRTELAIHISE